MKPDILYMPGISTNSRFFYNLPHQNPCRNKHFQALFLSPQQTSASMTFQLPGHRFRAGKKNTFPGTRSPRAFRLNYIVYSSTFVIFQRFDGFSNFFLSERCSHGCWRNFIKSSLIFGIEEVFEEFCYYFRGFSVI